MVWLGGLICLAEFVGLFNGLAWWAVLCLVLDAGLGVVLIGWLGGWTFSGAGLSGRGGAGPEQRTMQTTAG